MLSIVVHQLTISSLGPLILLKLLLLWHRIAVSDK